jgi:hypothetical protein
MKQLVTYASHVEDPTAYAFMVFDSIEDTEKFFRTAQIYFEMYPGDTLQTIYLTSDKFVEYTNYMKFRNDFEVKNISNEQYQTLKAVFTGECSNHGACGEFGHTQVFDIIECFGNLPYEEKPELVKELTDLYPECDLALSGEDGVYIT